MKFFIAFNRSNVFSYDAKGVTNLEYVQRLQDDKKDIRPEDQAKAILDPDGLHGYGTLLKLKAQYPGAEIQYA